MRWPCKAAGPGPADLSDQHRAIYNRLVFMELTLSALENIKQFADTAFGLVERMHTEPQPVATGTQRVDRVRLPPLKDHPLSRTVAAYRRDGWRIDREASSSSYFPEAVVVLRKGGATIRVGVDGNPR